MAEYQRLRAAQQEAGWRESLERAVQVGARIRERRAGESLTPPGEILRQVREERDGDLR